MKYNKTIILKDGRECILRNGTEHDAQESLDAFILTHRQTDYLLSYSDEITFTAKEQAEYLKAKTESDREIEILAVVGGKVAGMGGIAQAGKHRKTCHRAEFGVSVDKAYWGLGIGRALTRACIECAEQAGFGQLELEAVADNTAAISLYKSEGFVEYGRNPAGFQSAFSGRQELVLMRKELNRQYPIRN